MLSNWIPDQNRYNLAGPPLWFQQKLFEFDDSLVVIPSRQSCLYRLAQRRKLTLPQQMVNDSLFHESDTRMLASYSLVPVTSIIPTIEWSDPYIFVELSNRAPWRQGGAEKVIQDMEAQEAKQEIDKKMKMNDHLNSLGKDAWGLYNKKIGVRSHMYIPQKKNDLLTIATRSTAFKVK